MRKRWSYVVEGWSRMRSKSLPATIAVTIVSAALLLPMTSMAQAAGAGAAQFPLAAARTEPAAAGAWQPATHNQAAWLEAMYRPQADAAWGGVAPPHPRPRGGATPEVELRLLPETNVPLLDFAAKLLGRPYRFGAESGAYDCSGFVRRVFAEFGFDLPHSSREQFTLGRDVPRDALQPGDLVFFRSSPRAGISHVGLYAGDGLFVHAARRAGRVRVDALSAPYFANHYAGARRLPIGRLSIG